MSKTAKMQLPLLRSAFLFKLTKRTFKTSRLVKTLSTSTLQRGTYCYTRALHTLKPTVISDITQNIDTEELLKKAQREVSFESGASKTHLCLSYIVRLKVEEMCQAAIHNLSPEEAKKLELIQLEYSFLYSEGNNIKPPGDVSSRVWLEAMTLSTVEERLKFYLSLDTNIDQMDKLTRDETELGRKMGQSIILEEHQENVCRSKRWGNHRLKRAILHEEVPLILDLGYGDDMLPPQLDETAIQLWQSYCANRESANPFHLMLASCPSSNPIYRYMQLFHAVEEIQLLMSLREESPSDLYETREMVYLTSKAKQDVEHFDPNTIYILGAYSNNFGDVKFRCVARSKNLKIRSQRLPIDKHVSWPKAPKNLDLQDMMAILLVVKSGGTWKEAFKHILKHGSSIPDWIKEGKVDNNAIRSKQQHKKFSISRKQKHLIKNVR